MGFLNKEAGFKFAELSSAGGPLGELLTSQNPYAEFFIGRPHVLTVDIENSSQVEDAIREALLPKDGMGPPWTLRNV
ncbi:unnamed protein product [Litomosoides sigmodontis]|uniref:alpha-1,6-mannosyl-glycoprotein 6-beta-N-acetylglucosaminyltransferase n=1 Tax=Litomosoides sigmodontis TaxID=42156 RepID=A0A3P6S1R9_LITSI|nr:unnamed protein product [Litomosoides sigmodontis]